MNVNDYKFNVGDKVITTDGRTGRITYICTCDRCKERGFYEPSWIDDYDGNTDYISDLDAKDGFKEFHRIGEYTFWDCKKYDLLIDIFREEKKLTRLKKQLETIEELENSIDPDEKPFAYYVYTDAQKELAGVVYATNMNKAGEKLKAVIGQDCQVMITQLATDKNGICEIYHGM